MDQTKGKLFGREPALIISFIAVVLGVGTSVGIPGLSQFQVAAIVVLLNAVAAIFTAITTRPIAPSVFVNGVAALAAVGTAYGFNVPSEVVGAVDALVLGTLALIMRGQVSPTGALTAVAPPAAPPVHMERQRP